MKKKKDLASKKNGSSFISVINNIFSYNSKSVVVLIEIICILLLIVAGFYFSKYKVETMKLKQGYTEKADQGMFWSETAFQYRYAKLFAESPNDLWQTLSCDTKLQYPEGVNSWLDYMTFMEPLHGWFYKVFIPKNIPFHLFIMWAVAAFSTLVAFVIYTGVRLLGSRPHIALFAGLSWMLVPAGFIRQVSNIYLKEDFSVVFVALFIIMFIVGMTKEKKIYPIIGSISLFIALISWHLSQFTFLLLMSSVLFVYIFSDQWNANITRNLKYYTFTGIIASLVPVLFIRTFIVSTPMLMCYAILLSIYLINKHDVFKRKRYFKILITIGTIAIVTLLNILINPQLKEYSHVFQLMVYKLIYFGGDPPSDPSLLPFATRLFWAGAFDNTTLSDAWKMFYYSIFLTPITLFLFIFSYIKKLFNIQILFNCVIWLLSLISFIFINRLMIIFTIFNIFTLIALLLYINQYFVHAIQNIKKKNLYSAMISFSTFVVFFILIIQQYFYVKSMVPEIEDNIQDKQALFAWINENTAPDEAFIGSISDGPMLLLYTGRSVALNSQFENSYIRRKTEEFNTVIFKTEDDLYNYCRKLDVRYILLNDKMMLHETAGSLRYSVCMNQYLPKESAGAALQFYPDRLTKFAPVYDNNSYRVIRVLQPDEKRENFYWTRGWSPFYDENTFEKNEKGFVETQATLKKINDAITVIHNSEKLFSSVFEIMNSKQPEQRKAEYLAANLRDSLNKSMSYNARDLFDLSEFSFA